MKKVFYILIVVALAAAVGILGFYSTNLVEQYDRKVTALDSAEYELEAMTGHNENLQAQLKEQDSNDATSVMTLTNENGECVLEDCLIDVEGTDYPFGTATITGYFTPVERTAWDQTKVCDSFTTTGGSDRLIQSFVDLVNGGNTVHSVDENEQPVINLDLHMLSDAEVATVENSTESNQVELLVFNDAPLGGGAPVCYQDVYVLKVID